MAVRLIAGRAGSGKTHACLAQIHDALAEDLIDGPKLILLAPEQAALQMERALVTMSPAGALGRCEVLSFRRLAHRILNETTGPSPTPLTALGRQMALRYLIGRRRKELREFSRVAERPGFVAAIARGIAELLQEQVGAAELRAAAEAADAESDPSAARLRDSAVLLEAYLEYLGEGRVDPESVLALARRRLAAAPWIAGSHIWIDGFAGLTRQQMDMIVALAGLAAHVDVALLLEPGRLDDGSRCGFRSDSQPGEAVLHHTERTWLALAEAFREAEVAIEPPLILNPSPLPRFERCDALARLESRFLAQPVRVAGPPLTHSVQSPPVISRSKMDERVDCGWGCQTAGDTAHRAAAHVRLIRAADRRTEVRAAVTALMDLVQRSRDPLRYRDIAVVVRDLEPYSDLISAELGARGIPFFIDRRRPTHHHPLVQAVRALLAMHGEGPFDLPISQLLKSGLAGLSDDAADALENYVLAHGIVSAEVWEEAWTHPVRAAWGDDAPDTPAARRSLWEVNATREALRSSIGEWWPSAGSRGAQPACSQWTRRLYAVLERLQVRDRMGDWIASAAEGGELDEAEEHRQVWDDFTRLLDEATDALGSQRMTARQFRDVIEAGLAEFTLGLVPATLDQVLVSSIERSRHPPVRAVFVLGFAEGEFPARLGEDSIFSDDERERLNRAGVALGRTRRRRMLDERMLAYIALTRASEALWVSYPESDAQGRPVNPSPYWQSIRAALPELPVEAVVSGTDGALERGPKGTVAAPVSSVSDLSGGIAENLRAWCEEGGQAKQHGPWLALYEWARTAGGAIRERVAAALAALGDEPEAALSGAAASAIWPPPHRTSVTQLESFAACPFQHFARYGLRLSPRARHEIGAVELGSLYHRVLEQFVNELNDTGHRLADLSDAEIAADIARLCDLAIPQFAERLRIDAARQRHIGWRGGRDLKAAVAGQRKRLGRSALQPLMTERTFGGADEGSLPALEITTPGGRTVAVRGKIDRVDVVESGGQTLAVVFDYKRSVGRRLHLHMVFHGLALQLATYLIVLRECGGDDAQRRLVPGGAFYLPLVGAFARVDHPSDADEASFDPYDAFRPRGVLDFDFLEALDPGAVSGADRAFAVKVKKDGGIRDLEKSDAVAGGVLPRLLDHVRRSMGELADRWLSGDISVSPVQVGTTTPCPHCPYIGVCRFEYPTHQPRLLPMLKRSEVIERVSGVGGRGSGGMDGEEGESGWAE